ncbi:MAG: beta-ketoacyl-[acyl-carrier-protein] synthase family protein [Nitrospirae bacterium]|nr:beta-ketoacyl-[acyl-carrier-protein] synthase family protein [Nitrospirota bacterium]
MRRVVITGMGVISPIGNNQMDFFNNLMAGNSGIRKISSNLLNQLSVKIAAEVDFEPSTFFQKKQLGFLDRTSQFALAAASQAWKDSGISLSDSEKLRSGVAIGASMGGACTIEETYAQLYQKNIGRLKPFTVLMAMSNASASHISIEYGLKGPCLSFTVACSSSSVAIGEAYRMIKDGYTDVMVAGGAEALLTYGVMKAWESLGILAVEDKDNPSASCKPFSKNRTGFVLGEGAAIFVMEELNRAIKRNARIYGEMAGYSSTADTYHITKPSLEGQAHTISSALESASMIPDDIDYINAHGTATELNDIVETKAIKKVFGDKAYSIPVSSTKSMHGHMMGATGAVELLASVLAIKNQSIPPTANLLLKDPECDLDYVPIKGRTGVKVRAVMSNSFAFGGTNAILIVRNYE